MSYCKNISLSPVLQPGESWEILLDGNPYLPNPTNNSFDICGLDIGLHTIKVRRKKIDGTFCLWSEITFQINQNSSTNFLVTGNNSSLNIVDISIGGAYPYVINNGTFPVSVGQNLNGFIGTPGIFSWDITSIGTGTLVVYINGGIVWSQFVAGGGNQTTNTGPITMNSGDTIEFSTN